MGWECSLSEFLGSKTEVETGLFVGQGENLEKEFPG